MTEKLKSYVNSIFEEAPVTKKTLELKEEMQRNLTDKYNDLISEGKTPEAAFNLAVASVGDITSLLDELTRDKRTLSSYDKSKEKNKFALMTALSVTLYVLAIIPLLILQNETGLVLMFVIAAAATGLIIYTTMTKPRYEKFDETLVEDFKKWKSTTVENDELYKVVSSLFWTLVVVVYLLTSFYTQSWHLTWIIFLIGSALNEVIKSVFELLRKNGSK